jgi:uncharacterized membrane protein
MWKQLGFGFHFICSNPDLRALLITTALFWFVHDLGGAVYEPMILARTEGNATILGSTATALLYIMTSISLILIGLGGFLLPTLRQIEQN